MIAVACGLGILGLSAYGFLGLAGRSLGPAELAPLSVLWTLANAVGPGLFFPFEQEVARGVAHRRALGQGPRPLFGKATMLAGLIFAAVALIALVAAGPLSDWLFRGNSVLLVALVFAIGGLAGEHLTRGLFSGSGRFVRYGTQLGVDGALRLLGAVVLAVAATSTAVPYALLLAAAPILAVIATTARPAALLPPGPPAVWSDVTTAIGMLIAGNLLANVVINAGPVAVEILAGPGEQAAAGIFTAVLVLARIPLFAFAAIQAALLPGLARLAAVGDTSGFKRSLLKITAVVTVMALLGVGGGWLLGPQIVELLFGSEFATTAGEVALLAAASGSYMIAAMLAQASVALRGYTLSLVTWAAGSAAFFGLLAVPGEVSDRVGVAFLGGTLTSLIVVAAGIVTRLRRPLVPGEPEPPTDDFVQP